jgi:NAD(P) transhydrogenase subunit beta
MSANLSALAYLAAAVCFIFALKGLSSPISSRRGNLFGMAGMAIAIVTTLAQPGMSSFGWIVIAMAVGGVVGAVIALKIEMTAMPQLVAAFHSLVGLAAIFVAAAALYAPEAYGIAGTDGVIKTASRIEMSLGVIIGAITFTGSIIAFAKLQALMSGAPVTFPMQHLVNLFVGVAIVGLMIGFCLNQSP